jgi:ATP/ADP translocase
MIDVLGRWLKIYEDEISLFLWSALLLFFIRSSNILFNNFAETAFLKRFGVQYLPFVTAANSIITFFVMGFLSGLMLRFSVSRLLAYLLVFCGSSVAVLRLLIPLELGLLYPLFYVLKAQYELLLAFLFWNMANDLFNTRQSKRIFPLITASGIIGAVMGSFGTPLLAAAISMNNLLVAYLGTTLAGALVVSKMESLFPVVLVAKTKSRKKPSRSIIAETAAV